MQVGSTWRRSFTGSILIAALALSMWGRRHIVNPVANTPTRAHPVANTPTQSERTRATPAIPRVSAVGITRTALATTVSAANHNLDFSSDTGPGRSNGCGDPRLAFAKTEGATLSSDTGVGGSGSYL